MGPLPQSQRLKQEKKQAKLEFQFPKNYINISQPQFNLELL